MPTLEVKCVGVVEEVDGVGSQDSTGEVRSSISSFCRRSSRSKLSKNGKAVPKSATCWAVLGLDDENDAVSPGREVKGEFHMLGSSGS